MEALMKEEMKDGGRLWDTVTQGPKISYLRPSSYPVCVCVFYLRGYIYFELSPRVLSL